MGGGGGDVCVGVGGGGGEVAVDVGGGTVAVGVGGLLVGVGVNAPVAVDVGRGVFVDCGGADLCVEVLVGTHTGGSVGVVVNVSARVAGKVGKGVLVGVVTTPKEGVFDGGDVDIGAVVLVGIRILPGLGTGSTSISRSSNMPCIRSKRSPDSSKTMLKPEKICSGTDWAKT